MQQWLTLPPIIQAFFVLGCIGLLLMIVLLLKVSQMSLHSRYAEESREVLAKLHLELIESQRLIDEKLSAGQQQLFNNIIQDREKQLTSISQLRIELEQRFSQTSLSLTTNIHDFKAQMLEKFESLKSASASHQALAQQQLSKTVSSFGEKISQTMESYQSQTRDLISDNIRKGIEQLRGDLDRSIKLQNESIKQSILGLTDTTDNRLKEISGQVEKRLSEGFEKTTKTFNDVLKRLALIDDAQKKITELSSNVVSLQEILNDKRSRGAFGEVQLQSLVSNIMPQSHYSMQQKLSNDKIADCVLSLPEPTGSIAIDAKFPLESYRKMMDVRVAEVDRKEAAKQFARDIKKHLNDIADKYILPPETADGAVMFIPAESVFAEIHGHYPELVELAYRRKVWMVSPTTLMAILTTATAVIKDEQTRQQVHIIKHHLSGLGKDFARFQSRMDGLSKHIGQVSKDVELVTTSAKKITSRFDKIERVDLTHEEQPESMPLKPLKNASMVSEV